MPGNSVFLQTFLEPFVGSWLYKDSPMWTAMGFLGAAIFGSRFVLQWFQSEKEKKLVVPWYFWHLSFWGSVLNLLYFMHLDKAPLILGNCFLPFLYGRNIFFLRKEGTRGGRKVFAVVAAMMLLGFGYTALTRDGVIENPEAAAFSEMKLTMEAIKSYHEAFKALPPSDEAPMFQALSGDNAKKQRFLEKADGIDPWGHGYHLFINGKTILIRSAGKNGSFDDGSDDKRDDLLIEFSVP
ncbi:hypothetical protein BH11VER1_BH11VER1_05260 [soil metagenome]